MAPPSDLNKNLERLGTLLTSEIDAWEQRTRADRHRVMERVSSELTRALDRAQTRESRREAKHARREARQAAKRQAERENASAVGGVASILIAAAVAAFALMRPEFWWMIFIALGVGGGGARQLGLAAARKRELEAQHQLAAPAGSTNPPVQHEPAPVQHEVDLLCNQLLADLKSSPEAVRGFLVDPEKTVESLRGTAKSLDARRAQLAAEGAPANLAALGTQRAALVSRIAASGDAVARSKLEGALRSLDGQEAALKQLVAAQERVDGEYTSLLVLLQELKTRVAVARSTTSSAQLGGLQQSVQRLNAELEAITDSLVAAPGEGLTVPPPLADVLGEGAASGQPASLTERSH